MHARMVNRCIFAAAALGCLIALGNVLWQEYFMVKYYTSMYSPLEWTNRRLATTVRFPQRFPLVAVVHRYDQRVEVHNVLRHLYARWRWYDRTGDAMRHGQGVERYYSRFFLSSGGEWEVCMRVPLQGLSTAYTRYSRTWERMERQVPVPKFECRFVRQLPPHQEKEHRELFSRGAVLLRKS